MHRIGTMKSSVTDPLRIATVSPPDAAGVIGLTLCPGKKDPSRGWDRDLDTDLAVIREWGAEVVVTLVERHELQFLLRGATAKSCRSPVNPAENHFSPCSAEAVGAFGTSTKPQISQ
jgi:hypothetical protein